MDQVRTWRARWGNFVVALMFVALFVPTLDMLVCANDVASDSTTKVEHVLKVADSKSKQAPSPLQDSDDAGCIHGHCHHSLGELKLSSGPEFALAEQPVEPSFGDSQEPLPGPANSLLRPPRA